MGRVFAYGKIPALGDFFRREAPQSFVRPWDSWLQTIMAHGRQALGDRWQECYLSAPIWRFTLAPGLAGPLAIQGVLMPSVDRVGRFFPLTLARVVTGDPTAEHEAAPTLFAALEDIALDTLEPVATADGLDAALAEVTLPAAQAQGPATDLSHWSALIGDTVTGFSRHGLPGADDAARLFDPAPIAVPPIEGTPA